jgi:ligand-binding sensor domain-containing protein/signal transduction histidine kinase
MNSKYFFIIVLFLIAGSVYSQVQPQQFQRLDARNGLSHNSVLTIFQDSKGLIWLGTYGGLNKYDGYKITTYRTEHGNKNSLQANSIVAIHEDINGMLWLGTFGGGLIQFDSQREIFKSYRYLHVDPNHNITPNVRSIYEDDSGALWIASSEGLVKFDQQLNKYTPYIIPADVHAENNITAITKSKKKNKLWIGSYLGLKLFDLKTGRFTMYKPDSKNPNSLSHPNVLAIYEDHSGIVWVGTEGGGLDAFDPATKQFKHYKNDPANPASISGNVIFSIYPYSSQKLLIATESGLNIFDLATRTAEYILHDPKNPTSLSSNNVRCIFKDRGEVLWIGTDGGGVNKTDTQRKKFFLYRNDPDNNSSLKSNNVFSILEDHVGKIWIGTIDGGLNRYDRETKRIVHFLPDSRNPASISSTKILSLSTGPSKNLWIGTDRDGLCMVHASDLTNTKREPTFIKFYKEAKPNALNSNVIYSLLEDRTGVVWAGTWSRGVNKLVFNTRKTNGEIDYTKPVITHYRRDPQNSSSLSHDVAFTLYEDRQGTLWIGTAGGGLNKREVIRKEVNGKLEDVDVFRHYVHHPDDSTSLSDNNISAIYESTTGDFWVGTAIGLNKMNRVDGTCTLYTIKDGLPNNMVFGILEDSKHNLWIGTLGGIAKFDPLKETFRTYTYEDGLQDNMFNPNAFCHSKSGEMFFGGPNGITSFFPDSIKNNSYKPQVFLTDFRVFNKTVAIGTDEAGDERLKSSLLSVKEINLSHKDYVFSFEFSASGYANSVKNKFAYKMENFDADWVYTDNSNRTATYTNLNPGKYIFRVKASNNDGIWNEEGIAVRINIKPPFWRTWWFITLAIGLIIGSLFFMYKLRISIIKKQKGALENLVAERTKEIVAQKEEIQTQKENIEEKNVILENQYLEIETARKVINEQNEELKEYNAKLEVNVKKRTEQLRVAFNNLAETNKELDQFIYRSAHDLKGPLARIAGLCYLGSLETKEPKMLELLKKMEITTDEMSSKLTRLMKIHEFNVLELAITPMDYQTLLSDIILEVTSQYRCDDIQFVMNVEEGPPFKSDRNLMKILLYNVIENAVKYKDVRKPNCYVIISVAWNDGITIISITDNGLGIPQNQATRVFDLFIIANEKIKGFGIGLYEAKLIARRLGGNIKLQYPESGDTEFVITV